MRIGKSGLLLLLIGVHSFGDAEEGKVDLLIPDELARCMDQVRSENDEIKLIYGNPFYLTILVRTCLEIQKEQPLARRDLTCKSGILTEMIEWTM